MSRHTVCAACGKRVEFGNYCPICGTGMDEESQEEALLEHERAARESRIERTTEFLRERFGEERDWEEVARALEER